MTPYEYFRQQVWKLVLLALAIGYVTGFIVGHFILVGNK